MNRLRALISSLFLALTISVVGVHAETFTTPQDGSSWAMRFKDPSWDRIIRGEVTYAGGQYRLEVTGIEHNGVLYPEMATSAILSELVSDSNRIVFKVPKLELRWADKISLFEEIAVYPDFENLDDYITEPGLRPGYYIDDQISDEARYSAVQQGEVDLLSEAGRSPRLDLGIATTYFVEKEQSAAFRQTTQIFGLSKIGETTQVLPFEKIVSHVSQSGTSQTIEKFTRETTIQVFSSTQPGIELALFNPWVSDGGERVYWDWTLYASGRTEFSAQGGLNDGVAEPIVWGPKPQVVATYVIEDQFARTNRTESQAYYPYPFDESDEAVAGPRGESVPWERNLFVVGRNLSLDEGQLADTVSSSDETIKYAGIDTHSGLEGLTAFLNTHLKTHHVDGVADQVLERARQVGEDVQVVRVSAILQPDIESEYKKLRLNGEEVNWMLLFGDNGIRFRFVRQDISARVQTIAATTKVGVGSGGGEELAKHLFMRDLVVLEGEIEGNQPLEYIDVALAQGQHGHKPLTEGISRVRLHAVPGQERIFRSREFVVVDRSKLDANAWEDLPEADSSTFDYVPRNMALALRPDTSVRLEIIGSPKMTFQVRSPFDTAEVATDPSKVFGTFINALERSYQCHSINAGVHYPEISGEEERQIATRFLGVASRNLIKVTHGNHAALLMVRDLFVERMNRVRSGLVQLENNYPASLNYFHAWRTNKIDPEAPPSILREVLTLPQKYRSTLADGQPRTFLAWSKMDSVLDDSQRANIARASVLKQIEQIDKTLKLIGDVGNCKTPDLILYFADAAQGLIDEIMPTLMREELDSKRNLHVARPDPVARAAFNELRYLKLELDEAQAVADGDIRLLKTTLFVASAPAGYALAAGYVSAASATKLTWLLLAAEGTDFTITATKNLQNYLEQEEALTFAKGGSQVLGENILDIARATQESRMWMIADSLLSLAGAANAGADVFAFAAKGAAAADGAKLVYNSVDEIPVTETSNIAMALQKLAERPGIESAQIFESGEQAIKELFANSLGDHPLLFANRIQNMDPDDLANVIVFAARHPPLTASQESIDTWRMFNKRLADAKTAQRQLEQTAGLASKLVTSSEDLRGVGQPILDANDFREAAPNINPTIDSIVGDPAVFLKPFEEIEFPSIPMTDLIDVMPASE